MLPKLTYSISLLGLTHSTTPRPPAQVPTPAPLDLATPEASPPTPTHPLTPSLVPRPSRTYLHMDDAENGGRAQLLQWTDRGPQEPIIVRKT